LVGLVAVEWIDDAADPVGEVGDSLAE